MVEANEVERRTGVPAALVSAVIEQLGADDDEIEGTLRDVSRGGADAGFPGFTYYRDTVEFYAVNRAVIVELLEREAQGMGDEGPISLVRKFRCMRDESESTIARTLYGNLTDDCTQAANCLAWFALEEVAHAVADR